MTDSVFHNTRSRNRVVSDIIHGAGVGGTQAFPSSGRDDKPGLTQTPTLTLPVHTRRRTERGPSMFGAQGPHVTSDGSNPGSKEPRVSPTAPGTGVNSVGVNGNGSGLSTNRFSVDV